MPLDTKPLSASAITLISVHDVAWMAGLLEGEGYFFFNSNKLGVRLVMTDADVVSRFAQYWQVRVTELKTSARHHKTPYLVHLPVQKAFQCMQLVRPFMGERRAVQIDEALRDLTRTRAASREVQRLRMQSFSDEKLIEAWGTRSPAESMRAFCRRLGATSRRGVQNRLEALGLLPGEGSLTFSPLTSISVVNRDHAPSDVQAAWLAGLLEGEGCFTHAGGAAVALKMTDLDVVERYAALVGVRCYEGPLAKKAHYKPHYVAIASGNRGSAVMTRILPYMGDRRSAKILECLQHRAAGQALTLERKQAFRASREIRLPSEGLNQRLAAGASLSELAREYDVHPQVMKNRLLELGKYTRRTVKSRTLIQHTCEFCKTSFIRPATVRGQFCSQGCSGRAQAQRRAAQLSASVAA